MKNFSKLVVAALMVLGLTTSACDKRSDVTRDSLTFDVVKQWRAVHFPITLAFVVLALAHIIAIALFWGWK